MRWLALLLPILLNAQVFYKGNLGIGTQHFDDQSTNEIYANIEVKKEFDDAVATFKAKAIYDTKDENRRSADLSEIYYGHFFDEGEAYIGKQIRFFGNLESGNIVDIYNPKDLLYNPFEKEEKIGSIGVRGLYFLDDGKLELIVKVQEESRELFGKDSFYNQFGNLSYDKSLDDNSHSIMALYSSSYELGEFSGDFTVFINDGFDNHRTFYFDGSNIREKLYKASQYGLFANAIYNDTILKLEELYTHNEDSAIGDYNHIAFGVEHTFYSVFDKSDLRVFAEYFYLDMQNDLKGSDIGEIYDNDLFVGTRVDLNNQNSTTLQLGVIQDQKNDEQITQVEIKSRVFTRLYSNFAEQTQNLGTGRAGVLVPIIMVIHNIIYQYIQYSSADCTDFSFVFFAENSFCHSCEGRNPVFRIHSYFKSK